MSARRHPTQTLRACAAGHQAWLSVPRVALATVTAVLVTAAAAQQPAPAPATAARPNPATTFITGVPTDLTDAWALAYGGRMYDTWWLVLGEDEPVAANPAYPTTGTATGADTWTCTACHGWDYKGASGAYGPGSTDFTGVKGILAASGQAPAMIAALLRAAPHSYTPAMIPDDALARLALFISKGLYDTNAIIDPVTRKVSGNVDHGRAIFQTVCAACHGLDGRQMNFATAAEPEYVGTVASNEPEVVLHKLMNGIVEVPDDLRAAAPFAGAAGTGLGLYPAAMETWRGLGMPFAIDVLAYAQTLPQQ